MLKDAFGIANQDVCDVCKVRIRDELTRKRNRYNDTKLKRMDKLTNQEMLQMYKVCACFELCEMEKGLKVWMGVIGDRWIGGELDGENGMLCVHVIGYKARRQVLVQDLQAEA